jgi:hypothetical protein
MKRTVTVTETKEIEIETPCFRRWTSTFYMVTEETVTKVETATWPEINSFPSSITTPWHDDANDCTPSEFYEAFARTMQRLKDIAGIEELTLQGSVDITINLQLPLDDNDSDRFNADEASELKEKNDWDSQMDGIR